MLGSVGMTLVVATLLGGALGYWLDGRLGTTPWLTLSGVILGIISGFVELFRVVNRYSNTD
jgi:F0F1-type ATP synthase assembly protein I